MKKCFLQYILVSLIAFALTGCQDILLKEEPIGEGQASISATLDFKPMSSALGRTRAAGDALKDIKSLHVLVYDSKTKSLEKSWEIAEYSESDEQRGDVNAENGTTAEARTKRATFKLPGRLDFGEYYMYAVANIPDLLTNPKYSEAIKTVEGLKNIPLEWNPENVGNNGQMIGCLMTTTSNLPIPDEPVTLKADKIKLHAWLRRAASKVTVAFDGSGLNDGVSIYLKALRIKNIPKSCLLGADNTITELEDLIATGEEVRYSESANYDANYSALITKDQPYYPVGVQKTGADGTTSWEPNPDRHSETNPNSLFFYENLQGTGPDKVQSDNNGDGILDDLYQYKDMPYATYIEVDTYYESTDPERPGICNITYRFMLGQDIIDDYNAKRNCHYKLTLHLNGYADDPDWRIDYVTRLWATQPETVDYRGEYFVPDNTSSNQGHTFSADNIITVTSFMYENDDWYNRKKQAFKIEYKDEGSTAFSEEPPTWLEKLDTVGSHKGNGVYELKIGYKNPYTPVNINQTLSERDAKTGVYDLATKGGTESMNTANCYIVDSKGSYSFPLVYGNAITDGNTNTSSYTYGGWVDPVYDEQFLKTFKNYKDMPIGNAYILDDIYGSAGNAPANLTASLVWQDESNLIDLATISYDKALYGGKGGIKFSIGTIKEGNAVIALKDPSGMVMWSWHIWVTALDFSRKITLTSRNSPIPTISRNIEILPVNLGWCSGGTPARYYDRHECEVKFTQIISGEGQEGVSKTVKIIQEPHIALPVGNNPYFQWGRKDPFVAGGNGNETNKTWYNSSNATQTTAPAQMYTGAEDTRVSTYKATATLIQNPDKWQNPPRTPNGTTGFLPDAGKEKIFFNLWNNTTVGNTDVVVKTVYDPCPAGYHVSALGTFTGFTDTGNAIQYKVENGVITDIVSYMYGAIEDNMMPKANDSDTEYKKYRDDIFEFYTDDSKLISIGFPMNGYRDWDDNAYVLQYSQGCIWSAQAWSWIGKYSAYYLQFSRGVKNPDGSFKIPPHIAPWTNFYATDGMAVRPAITLP